MTRLVELSGYGRELLAALDEQGVPVEQFHPVLIGRGKPLFPPSDTWVDLRLAETRTFGNGVVLIRYERPGARD